MKNKLNNIVHSFLALLKRRNRRFDFVVQILISLVLISFDRIFMAYKWHILLKVKDTSISFSSAVRSYYIGTFIGFFLPATVGGDIVRVLKLRSARKKGTDVLSSVILERMLGLIAAAILAPIAILFLISFFELDIWIFLVITGVLLFLFIILMLIPFNEFLFQKINKNQRLAKSLLFDKFKKLYQSYAEYKNHRSLLVLFLILSILEQLIPVVANYLACRALNLSIPFIYFLLIIPLVQLLSKIPISFEGFGINEGLLVYFFALLGLSGTGAFTIGLLGHISIMIAALPGLYFYIKDIRTSFRQGRNESR